MVCCIVILKLIVVFFIPHATFNFLVLNTSPQYPNNRNKLRGKKSTGIFKMPVDILQEPKDGFYSYKHAILIKQ